MIPYFFKNNLDVGHKFSDFTCFLVNFKTFSILHVRRACRDCHSGMYVITLVSNIYILSFSYSNNKKSSSNADFICLVTATYIEFIKECFGKHGYGIECNSQYQLQI